MKKYSTKTAKMMQQGGLMIEALAMLGLISVVTPTMYKKAAERTMEVEDINTASAVRTYANAAEAYINNNYGELMKENLSDGEAKNLSLDDIKPYLPYGFNTSRNLYDYGTPNIKIVKNGNNFTAFTLFPLKQGAVVGQERTARIASLIGSSGGYVYDEEDGAGKNARGVGGLWSIPVSTFGENNGGSKYSLVTMSSDIMSDVNAADMDNDKYLQRTREEGDDELWRNTMRTDLYLGGHLGNETQVDSDNELHSIRNVKSLIIGAEHADEEYGNVDNEAYGLFVSGDAGDNYTGAYIGGYLSAFENHFFVKRNEEASPTLYFGRNDAGAGFEGYNFVVNDNGDIHDNGYGGELFSKFYDTENTGGNRIRIGQDLFVGTKDPAFTDLFLMNSDIFSVYKAKDPDYNIIKMLGSTMTIHNSSNDSKQRISMFKEVNDNGITERATGNPGIDGKDSLGNDIGPKYNPTTTTLPDFRVDVGANVKVQGVLAAGQVDTQHLRTASFSSGSENIDDAEKWMTVDQYGIKFGSSNGGSSAPLFMMHSGDSSENSDTAATGSYKGIRMASAGASYTPELDATGGGAVLNLVSSRDTNDNYMAGSGTGAYAELRAGDTHLDINADDYEITLNVGGTTNYNNPNNYGSGRVRQLGGNFDLDAANLNVTDKDNKQVFAVRGNDSTESQAGFERFNNPYTSGISADYNVAAHGNTIFTGSQETITSTTPATTGEMKYLSIGRYNNEAGVNISATGKNASDYIKNVLFVDQSEDKNSQKVTKYARGTETTEYVADKDNIEAGTVYIRKGMIEVVPDSEASNQDAFTGTGVIQASRFVANNNDSNGQAAFVPDQLKDNEYSTYNGGGKTDSNTYRYDTYMVNPAYTSVMKDIKLTTRGGARLSDILPDFINKGIYVANNTYGEETDLTFSGWGSSSEGGGTYASPFLGEIPAPQCPPGYGKVIAVHPISFNMAQAGQSTVVETNQNNPRFIVNQGANLPRSSSYENGNDTVHVSLDNSLAYAKLSVNYNSNNNGGTITLKENVAGTETAVSHEVTNASSDIFKVNAENSMLDTYVLTSDNPNAAKPITFQQSTYLKTVVVPLCEGSSTGYGDTCGTYYTSGWAALMGFIYPGNIYASAFTSLGTPFITDTTTNTTWYWNIFPVLKNSLEAYATVYCYFDRTNMGGRYRDRSGIDTYDYLNDNPKQFVPDDSSKAYRQRLNDPTLKYNELW
ncbi:MAG: hypothetical protein IJ099_07580 [Alphaproteobacteria bacterium]|nr:hypothetical protein [Alphaproteobacteria bacterium]